MTKTRQWLVGLSVALCTGACGASQQPVQTAAVTQQVQGDAAAYAAALEQAFDRYEAAVETARRLTYRSQAEAETVIRSLSAQRFDFELRQALAQRGLSVRSLGQFAEANPEFFHAQQRLHWGRFQTLQAEVGQLAAQVVRPEQQEEGTVALHQSE